MIKQIKYLSLSTEDKIKVINIINNQEFGSIHLEKILNTCFLFLPEIHEKFSKQTKNSSIYKCLLEHDNAKRSIALKTMLDTILNTENRISNEELDMIFQNLCNHKIVNMKISISKYKIYIDTILSIDSKGVEWVKEILTSDSILKLDDNEYQNIADEIGIIALKKKKGSFDDDGNWDLLNANYHQISAYKKILRKKKCN